MFSKIVKTVTLAAVLTGAVQAREVVVTIVNNTSGSSFTPLLVTTHDRNVKLFEVGEEASNSLQAMAEGGNIEHLVEDLQAENAIIIENPAEGLLNPGEKTKTTIKRDRHHRFLSIVGMILPTNDGFVALKNWKIPRYRGTYTIELNAYDAGTEANDEIINGVGASGEAGIPADPNGNGGTGAAGIEAEAEGFVHIHRGIVGDLEKEGGVSDLDASRHRWNNPVATVIVRVK